MEVRDYRDAASSLDEPDFVSKHGEPVLLVYEAAESGAVSFDTALAGGTEELARGAAGQQQLHSIWALKKSESNPYADRISVGRTGNCDIVIKSQKVSKLHAHLRRDDTRGWAITDLKSSNGTFVNGRRLEPMESAPVHSGDHLQFGSIVARFVGPDRLWRMLQS